MNALARWFQVIACGLWLVTHTYAATLFHTDDFESGTLENWTGASPTNQPTGGPQGADDNFLQLVSNGFIGPASRMAVNTPPFPDPNSFPHWIGHYAAAGIEIITVDMMVPVTSPSLEMRLVLFGPTTDNNRWTSTNAMTVPNDGTWRNYSFSVAEANLTFVPLLASSATYSEMIADVRRVMLRHDPGAPSPQGVVIVATLGIDNVTSDQLSTPGDFDGDGDVDGFDFLQWQLDPSVGPLADWKNNYGTVDLLSVASSAVPEPASVWLMLATTLVISRRIA